ncbi:MAG TPA: hypothetical protein VFP15_05515 [Gemmatimonadaceae bacterium]|nr:hypothetical protein [Gemmatimonadaceae bacterium]
MRRLVAVSSFAFTFLAPVSAQAQFGGLVRRAAEKVAKKELPQSSSSSGQAKIDEGVVTHMLAGLAEEAKVADSIGRASLARNAEVTGQVDAFLKRYATYSTARASAIREHETYQSCIGAPSQEVAAMAQSHPASAPPGAMEFAQRREKMSPEERTEFEAKMDKLEKEAKAAEKSGDVAEQVRIRNELQQLTGVSMAPSNAPAMSQADMKKMQDAGDRMSKCAMPKPFTAQPPEAIMVRPVVNINGVSVLSPSATRRIADSSEAQAYLASLRSMHVGNEPIVRGAGAAGMDQGQYGLLRERMLYIYANAAMRGESAKPSGFSDEEYDALQARRSEIVSAAERLKRLGAF